jgi:hypothetical protein
MIVWRIRGRIKRGRRGRSRRSLGWGSSRAWASRCVRARQRDKYSVPETYNRKNAANSRSFATADPQKCALKGAFSLPRFFARFCRYRFHCSIDAPNTICFGPISFVSKALPVLTRTSAHIRAIHSNAYRLYKDALVLKNAGCISSAIVLISYSLEEIGKLLDMDALSGKAPMHTNMHRQKERSLKFGVVYSFRLIAISEILGMPLSEVMRGVYEGTNLVILGLFQPLTDSQLASLSPDEKRTYDEVIEHFLEHTLTRDSIRISSDIDQGVLKSLRERNLYVYITADGEESYPQNVDTFSLNHLIADAEKIFACLSKVFEASSLLSIAEDS